MHFAEIEGAEVGEEGFVDEVVVDGEVKSVRPGFGRIPIRDPIKFILDDFNGLVIHFNFISK